MSSIQASFLPDIAPNAESHTPLMLQYLAVKGRHQDCLLFFRLGDFYELFFEDAVTASKALDIALTRRGQHQGQDIPMCGVPAHAYENYLAKLIRNGHRVAICEQSETPEQAKKRAKATGGKSIVARDVVRIITPGTITEDGLLDARATNFLACLTLLGDDVGVAWCDIISGHIHAQNTTVAEVAAVLARLDASEILIAQRLAEMPEMLDALLPWRARLVTQPNGRFDSDNARKRVLAIYNVGDVSAFGEFSRVEVAALGTLLDYVELTQKTDLKHFNRPVRSGVGQVAIDVSTRRNLEVVRTLAGERRGSLLDAVDCTETGAGARLLCMRLNAPLTDVAAINSRLNTVEFFVAHSEVRHSLRASLKKITDLERALARLILGRGGPRDLAAIRDAIKQTAHMRRLLLGLSDMPPDLRGEAENLGVHDVLAAELEKALAPDLPYLARDGNFIAKGYSWQLDELILLRDDGRRVIAALQHKYATESGVNALKIKHNNVIGYYIEVSTGQADRLFADKDTFIHRQTLANAARFTTIELSEMERKISEAADKALGIELDLFSDLVTQVTNSLIDLKLTAQSIASLDVGAALAELAVSHNYVRPQIDESLDFKVTGGRHPVVEQALRRNGNGSSFIANGCDLAPDQRLWLITGPNMAGKSTFLRQNALIVLLAQMGSFVPATFAHIGVVDRVFSRVGASDDLAAGRSTFMVEMVETAAILNQASERALVILDEIGRGTATFDGLSIAWATLEYLHDVNKCRALFATHYHELTTLSGTLAALRRTTVRVKEWQGKIHFMHEVIEGTADRSYGIHVGQMAGLPDAVIARAEQVLSVLEDSKSRHVSAIEQMPSAVMQKSVDPKPRLMGAQLEELLKTADPDTLTPREALELLYRIKAAAI